jgi:hypothetical protein
MTNGVSTAQVTAGAGVPAVDTKSDQQKLEEITDEAQKKAAEDNEKKLRSLEGKFDVLLVAAAGWASIAAGRVCPTDPKSKCGFHWTDLNASRKSVIVTTLALAGTLLFLSWAKRKSGGLNSMLIGKDNRFSTSQTQVAMWTMSIVWAVLFLILKVPFGKPGGFGSSFEQLDIPYMILLGGPFAAAALSRDAIGRKVDAGEVQKTIAAETSLSDVISDDNGNPDIVDVQFFLFNVAALVFFIVAFTHKPSELPAIPLGLVGLTGVAALAFTGNKLTAQNAPTITSITKRLGTGGIRPGEEVLVLGSNLIPPGGNRPDLLTRVRVRFGDREIPIVPDSSVSPTNLRKDRIIVRVPDDLSEDTVLVSVITAASAQSNTYTLRLVPDVPVITGVAPVPVVPGGALKIIGRFFQRPTGTRRDAAIMFDDIAATGVGTTDTEVEVAVPIEGLGKTVAITVRSYGGLKASEPVVLPVVE